MNYCESIQKSIDFFEQHIKDDIDINTVVQQSCFSVTHFYRIFQALTGESLKDYIQKRRLSEAAIELCISKKRLIDIAFEYGFNSQEVFTRAFSKLFGITPGRYRVLKKKITLFEKVNAYQKMRSNLNQLIYDEPRIIFDKEFRIVGMMKRVKPGDDLIRDLWNDFNQRIPEIKNSVSCDGLLGLCEYMPDITDESKFTYIACIEVSSFNYIPDGMITKIIPHSKYAVFTHKGCLNGLKDTYKFIYGAWLPNSGYELAELDTIELYCSNNNKSMLDIYIPIK